MEEVRIDRDMLCELKIPKDALYGIHTQRGIENFNISNQVVHVAFWRAMGDVKHACARCSKSLDAWRDNEKKAEAIIRASLELAQGNLDEWNVSHALQGGAGTTLNMNVNEVIANRANVLLGYSAGQYDKVSPLNDVNLHQSTNDVCPTALRVALMRKLPSLVSALRSLSSSFNQQADAHMETIKVGRTQFQDAVITSAGREFRAYALVISRGAELLDDIIPKLGTVNLGGTAIGTSFGAPAPYVKKVVDILAAQTGLPLRASDDLVDATQNHDTLVELTASLKVTATQLIKIAADLRFLSSGPQCGIGEIHLPEVQAGSSIMPGKVNPVMTEMLSQVCFAILGHEVSISVALMSGNLELNPFLPMVAHFLLNDIEQLTRSIELFNHRCIEKIEVDSEHCRRGIESSTALITALVPILGYDRACEIGVIARKQNMPIAEAIITHTSLCKEDLERLLGSHCLWAQA